MRVEPSMSVKTNVTTPDGSPARPGTAKSSRATLHGVTGAVDDFVVVFLQHVVPRRDPRSFRNTRVLDVSAPRTSNPRDNAEPTRTDDERRPVRLGRRLQSRALRGIRRVDLHLRALRCATDEVPLHPNLGLLS